MKKTILNLGKALNKAEQKEINGGYIAPPACEFMCNAPGMWCKFISQCECFNDPKVFDACY